MSRRGLTVTLTQQTNQATATVNWRPTTAAEVTVTFAATDLIDTAIVPVTFVSPGPCCYGPTAEIWDPTTNAVVGPLENGMRYCLRNYNMRGGVVLSYSYGRHEICTVWPMARTTVRKNTRPRTFCGVMWTVMCTRTRKRCPTACTVSISPPTPRRPKSPLHRIAGKSKRRVRDRPA